MNFLKKNYDINKYISKQPMYSKNNNKLSILNLKLSDENTSAVSSNHVNLLSPNGGNIGGKNHTKKTQMVCSCAINKNKVIFKNNLFIKKEADPCFSCMSDNKSQPLKVIFKIKKITENVINNSVNIVQEHYCGRMDKICSFCNSLNFEDERTTNKIFKSCCHGGKVAINNRREFPKYLKDLWTNTKNKDHKNFKKYIRSYNSAISFASFGAKTNKHSSGPYCLKIHGQTYHHSYHPLSNNGDSQRKYSQLYVVDTEMATNIRLNNVANSGCQKNIL